MPDKSALQMRQLLRTLFGWSNMDLFYLLIPPLCISSSLRSLHTLLFDYIIAVYPIIVTIAIYVAIELYNRNCRIVVHLSSPYQFLWHRNWRTCATFLIYHLFAFCLISVLTTAKLRWYLIHLCSLSSIHQTSSFWPNSIYCPSIADHSYLCTFSSSPSTALSNQTLQEVPYLLWISLVGYSSPGHGCLPRMV